MPKLLICNVTNTSFNPIPENKILKLPNLKYVLHGGIVAQLDKTLLVDLGEPARSVDTPLAEIIFQEFCYINIVCRDSQGP